MKSKLPARLPFVLLGIGSLVAGVWGGLARLPMNVPLPGGNATWLSFHGPLMVCGFLGTVIALERAVGLGSLWTFVPPLLTGVGSAIFISGRSGPVSAGLILGGSVLFWVVTLKVVRMQPAPFTWVMSGGALAWVVGNALWFAGIMRPQDEPGWPIYRIVPWWIVFLLWTILGERLDLSRFQRPSKFSSPLLIAVMVFTTAGLVTSVFWEKAGEKLLGTSLLGTALWLGRFDLARRSVRNPGLPRFMAVTLLVGYLWLTVGGVLMLALGPVVSGPKYDAVLHAFFVGFVFSMIFAHAPVIFPAVLVVTPVFSRRFYGHVALLEAGLALRIAGDLAGSAPVRQWGAVVSAVAIAVFLLNTISALVFRPGGPPGKKAVSGIPASGSSRKG